MKMGKCSGTLAPQFRFPEFSSACHCHGPSALLCFRLTPPFFSLPSLLSPWDCRRGALGHTASLSPPRRTSHSLRAVSREDFTSLCPGYLISL